MITQPKGRPSLVANPEVWEQLGTDRMVKIGGIVSGLRQELQICMCVHSPMNGKQAHAAQPSPSTPTVDVNDQQVESYSVDGGHTGPVWE